MDRIEQWIRRKSSAAVAVGYGHWADHPDSGLGKPIYQVKDGPVAFILSELGFSYDGPATSLECRYDEVDLEYPPLQELIPKSGDVSRIVTLKADVHGIPEHFHMQFPLRLYDLVAAVLPRVIKGFA